MALAPSQRWEDAGNRYSLEMTAAPDVEPVTLAEAKLHLRVDTDDTDDDAHITALITDARIQAENICRRVFITSTWRFSMDHFPLNSNVGPVAYAPQFTFGAEQLPASIRSVGPYLRAPGEFEVPVSPFQSITAFTYIDSNGDTQSLTSADYEVDPIGHPATITPPYGANWPTVRSGRYGVRVTFLAGYGEAVDVPEPIKSWIKIQVATQYRNREGVALFRGTIQELGFFDRLLDPFRLYEF